MKILVTGGAGFIGFSFADYLLKDNKIFLTGIDNLDGYYSVKYKKNRIRHLKQYKKFKFKKIDISKKKNLNNFFKNEEFDIIFHFAAQPGVRYSLVNPKKYIKVNRDGFRNLLNCLKYKKYKNFFYASSSSIYGETKIYPVKESFKCNPKSIYAKTKVINEKDAKMFKKKYKKNIVGLRFFTVFGEWGRPDMFLFKLLNAYKNNKILKLNNSGNHYRDFTYIKDVVKILKKIIYIKKFEHDIYNICSSKPVSLLKIISLFNKKISFIFVGCPERNPFDFYNLKKGSFCSFCKDIALKNYE